ncbi:MAG: acyl-CoA dehydrogenase family protein [Syntrophorhabdales bacterium]
MDFRLTEEQQVFKEDVCAFLDREVTEEVVAESESPDGIGPHGWALMRKLGEKRWLAPTFPVEYGGLGLSQAYRYIVQHELDYRNAVVCLRALGLVGVDMAGPVILRHGSDELKNEILPKIARGEVELALGYTEPQAGSDLVKLSIRAVEDGDDFVITGQKLFNTGCHFCQYHWLAARTDVNAPPHKGISFFVVDMTYPGITLGPLIEISDMRTNAVFYDEVRVPKRYLVGEKNKGWQYITEALDNERMLVLGGVEETFEALVEYLKTTTMNGVPLSKDPLVRQKVADLAIEINIARNMIRRVVWWQDSKIEPPAGQTAVLKLFVSELYQKVARTGMEIMGFYGQLRKHSKYAVAKGKLEHLFRSTYVLTIGAGTSELMRTIIATRGLGLPR